MNRKYTPGMRERVLRMLAEAIPDHKNKAAAVRHVAGLLGMSPGTLRTWAGRMDVDAGRVLGPVSDMLEEKRRLRREDAGLRKANEVLKAASVFFAKEFDLP